MKLVAKKSAASEKYDRLEFVRHDGTSSSIDMPRQGVLPHDLVHYVVEIGFGFTRAFLSLVARGADARYVMEMTHDPANAEFDREAIVAEAIVEALQTQLWNGAFDFEAFEYGVRTACDARNVAPPAHLDRVAAGSVYEAAVNLHAQWAKVPPQGALELHFNGRRL